MGGLGDRRSVRGGASGLDGIAPGVHGGGQSYCDMSVPVTVS
jgi:hypothetical protein